MPPLDWMDVRALEERESGAEGPPGDAPELLEGLNEPQRRAVLHEEGPLLILAGAGSGKTRVITRRIAWLVATGRARPWEILAITFTNKAAGEMRERVERDLEEGARGLWIGTFHATCARILRREIEVLGGWTRDFTIYDTHDRNQLLKRIVQDAGYDPKRFRPAQLGAKISARKNARRLPDAGSGGQGRGEGLREGLGGGLGEGIGEGIEDEVERVVRERYEKAMEAANALDFDDLLLKALELFDRHPGVRDAYATRFRHVLVDEYQDTNRVQYLLVRHLASAHGNLAVCGDPDQSIYAWRGADVRNILDFEGDFGAAEVVKLEQNYRSCGNVLKAAQSVVRHNVGRKEKDLWTEREDGDPIVVLECGDENDEASEIALQVQALRERGRSPGEMAVFYRVNFMQRALERAFRLSGVPYQVVGGVEFYQRREIRDLLAWLQLLVNPRDDVAFRRAVGAPARGVGAKSLDTLAAWAAERGLSLAEAAASDEGRAGIRGRGRAGLEAFAGQLARLAEHRDGPALRALDHVLEETAYYDHLASLGDAEAAMREENVDELRTHAETYDRAEPEGGLRGFLQDVALVSDVDAFEEAEERVALMTLHAAKGLEFPVVFVAGLEEELLPHALALAESDGDAGLEEERRLLYVGMTRAQDRLFLSWARTRLHFGETTLRLPSRFLEELPPELVEGRGDDDGDPLGTFDPPDELAADVTVGDRVRHERFGLGRVALLQGSGINARATVDFDREGRKILLLQYARLEVVR